jgi:imidazole glycerol phosphate synthase subunit HisF
MAIFTIMPCLDMKNGRNSKSVHFAGMRNADDPKKCLRSRGLRVIHLERP